MGAATRYAPKGIRIRKRRNQERELTPQAQIQVERERNNPDLAVKCSLNFTKIIGKSWKR